MNTTPLADSGALFQIEEPGQPTPGKKAPGRGIGIDLGTTHSLVAIAPHGAAPRVLPDESGRVLLPSVVSYLADAPQVGWDARAMHLQGPERVVSSVKRFMGRGLPDIDFPHPYAVVERSGEQAGAVRFDMGAGRQVTAMEVSAEILKVLKARAERELGGPTDGAVITVPAYFDDAQRQATKDAGRIAGLKVYRLLAEPTAAALAYGLDQGGEGLFAVYDFGGGTFDISILRLRGGVFQVLATGGDSALGGDDLDRVVADHLLEIGGARRRSALAYEEARLVARTAKEALTDAESTVVSLEHADLAGYTLTRAEFEALVERTVFKTVGPCKRALEDAGVTAKDLDGVVLVGGSTRVPLVRELVASTFRCQPLGDIDPDRVVAYGAAIQADILSGSAREGVTLLDVVPLSLGIETMGGIVEKLIGRNATIPIGARQVFTNYSEQQTGMVIHVVQGERELAQDCRSLAKFELKGIPRLPPSMARVEVSFALDADALLTVTARELMTGVKQTIEVKPTYGLTEAEVDQLIVDSLEHAEDDFGSRNLAEARVELGRVVLAVRTALGEVGHLPGVLPPDERAEVEAALAGADETMSDRAATPERVRAVREQLEHVSEPFARRRMERALRAGMEGKTLDAIEQALAEEDQLDSKRGGHTPEITNT